MESNLEMGLTRRGFLTSAAAAGLVVVGGKLLMAQDPEAPAVDEAAISPEAVAERASRPDALKVGIIGVGNQGLNNLLVCCLRIVDIPIRFVAVTDIWPTQRETARKRLAKYGHTVNLYEDYREMLDKETDMDCVIVATPDWMHSEHTVACLKAGKHVYCEKEMSNTIEGAQAMVRAQRETGKLLQIGHQRRSNPFYLLALKMINNEKLFGRLTNFEGQWNRGVAQSLDLGWAKKDEIPADILQRHGYNDMYEFRNWRWFKKYSGGPIVDLGSHQIEVFGWFLGAHPHSVMAMGTSDYTNPASGSDWARREWYDNVMALFEYKTAAGNVIGHYQVLNTCGYGGYYELFLGDEGALLISEDTKKQKIFREPNTEKRDWEKLSQNRDEDGAITLTIGQSLDPSKTKNADGEAVQTTATKPVHQYHLENFFAAVQKGDASMLNGSGDISYESTAAVLKINEAVAAQTRLEYKPEEFTVS